MAANFDLSYKDESQRADGQNTTEGQDIIDEFAQVVIDSHYAENDDFNEDNRIDMDVADYTESAEVPDDDIIYSVNLQSPLLIQKEQMKNHEEMWQKEMEHHQETIKTLKDQLSLLMRYTTDLEMKHQAQVKILEDRVVQLENKSTEKERTVTGMCESENNTSNINEVCRNMNVLAKEIPKLDLSLRLLENTSYSGSMIWKIDNVSKRMNEAVVGSVTALHSAPVFTCQYGYKFCVRLYLNGDGLGKCTHVSLFIVIMKNEYDEILKWPFEKLITFRLINQKDSGEDLIESFRSNPQSSSFMKPKRELNVASGCPRFIEKGKLLSGGFVKNDTMFVEVSAL